MPQSDQRLMTSCAGESARSCWIRAIGVWLLTCLLVGVGGFVLAGNYFQQWDDHYWAAVGWELAFVVAFLPVLILVYRLQRRRNEGLAELGWLQQTSTLAVVLSLLLLGSYLFGMYMGVHYVLKDSLFRFHWVRVALLPAGLLFGIGEEVIMRGYFMNELKRARVATWLQIFLSAACSAAYHSFTTPMAFVSSFVMFGFLAGIFVLGRRSLTAPVLFHSLAHILCDPYALQMALNEM